MWPTRCNTKSPSRCPKKSLTNLKRSRSISTNANERPARVERFHSADSASMKKRWVLTPVRPSVMACSWAFWKVRALCRAPEIRSARVRSRLSSSEKSHGSDPGGPRSEEHTSELQSLAYLVCRLLLEKKKKKQART